MEFDTYVGYVTIFSRTNAYYSMPFRSGLGLELRLGLGLGLGLLFASDFIKCGIP